MKIDELIEKKLRNQFNPFYLKVIDDSESHRGHSGFTEGTQSHFNIEISSDFFDKKTRIQQHRAIHSALGPEIISVIHALAIKILI
ncbi:MAG: BolA family transcriptional regulator [Proteobacteria bacterium]|jgi:BolA protein|nr:BolA family transcriptional regulator [Pseudomonadota bacterium]MDA1238089.1 BolA family transcriptional regulator [Pseudomonadota bacterium]